MDKVTLAVVVAALGLVAVGLTAALVVGKRAAPPDPATPSGVVLAYALAEQRGDALAAWNLLASTTQARADKDRFLARAGTSAQARAFFTTEDERIDEAGASVVLVQTTPGPIGLLGDSSYSSRSTVRLVREQDGWRISVPADDYLLVSPPGVKP